MAKKKFEPVLVKEGEGWEVRIFKDGYYYTVCNTFCVPSLGDAKAVAEKIATLLNKEVGQK